MEKQSLHQDRAFTRIVVASTGLGLACMLGSAAAIRIDGVSGLQFQWHWSILLVALLVVLWNSRFWKLVWQLQEDSSGTIRRKLKFHLGVLLCMGVATFLYPIRFIAQGYLSGISHGLVTAVIFLGTLVFVLAKTCKGFASIDDVELERTGQETSK